MAEFPDTRESLILQVKDPSNRVAWDEFSAMYRPIIYRIARARGMQEADAQDLAQQVLLSVANAIRHWEKNEPEIRFRNWLSRITRNAIIKALSRSPRDKSVGGSAMLDILDECPAPDPATTDLIETEYRRQLYLRAAQLVQRDVTPGTWAAFELTVINNVPIKLAIQQLGKSAGTIYSARSRVMFRLREAVRDFEAKE